MTKPNGISIFSPNRRSFLQGMGAVGMAGAGLYPRRAQAATAMQYMCWEGYDKPSIIAPFEAAQDVKLSIDLITDSPGGFAKLAAGGWRDFDVVSTDSPWVQRMGPAGIAEFINAEDFADVYDSFYPQFRAPFAPLEFEGQSTGLPTRWGWVGPTVNTKFDSLEKWRSYAPCFDPDYKDKICVLDWGDWPIMPMALYAGINPYKELDAAELNEIRLVLRALFKNTRAVVGDLSVAQKGLMDGSFRTLIGGGTYCTSALRKDGQDHIMSIVPEPKDGLNQGIIWMEASGIVKDSVDVDKAKALLRHLTSPEVAVELAWTEATCNLVPSKAAEALFSDEQKAVLQMDYMWEAWEKSHFHDVAPNIDDMLEIWQQELAAAR